MPSKIMDGAAETIVAYLLSVIDATPVINSEINSLRDVEVKVS